MEFQPFCNSHWAKKMCNNTLGTILAKPYARYCCYCYWPQIKVQSMFSYQFWYLLTKSNFCDFQKGCFETLNLNHIFAKKLSLKSLITINYFHCSNYGKLVGSSLYQKRIFIPCVQQGSTEGTVLCLIQSRSRSNESFGFWPKAVAEAESEYCSGISRNR